MSFHIKIRIPRSKSSVEVHGFGRIFHAEKVNFSQCEVSNFQNFSGGRYPKSPLEELKLMAKIESPVEGALI